MGFPWVVNEGGGLRFESKKVVRVLKSERLPRETMSVQEAAEKRRVAQCVHLAKGYAARNLVYPLGMN